MALKPTDSVLENGSGPGYFSPAEARNQRQGKLVLYDNQTAMLEIAERPLKSRGLSTSSATRATPRRCPSPMRRSTRRSW